MVDLRATAEQLVREAANLEAAHRGQFGNVSDWMQKPLGRNAAAGKHQHDEAVYRDELSVKASAAWQRSASAIEALRAVDVKGAAEVQAIAARLVALGRADGLP